MVPESLLRRQSLEILALEENAKEQVLSTLRSAQSEIRNVLQSKGDLSTHYYEIQREIDGILAQVDPKVPDTAFKVGVAQAVETVSEETGLWIGTPRINVSALAAINLDTQRRISGITEDLKRTVADQLRVSIALGEGIAEATDRIAGLGFRRSLWRYEMVARTVTNEMANQGHLSTYLACNEQIPGLKLKKRYLAFVDHRTTPICQALNGEIREMNETFSNGVQCPPSHPNCRSRITAEAVKMPVSEEQGDTPAPVAKTKSSRAKSAKAKSSRGRSSKPQFSLPQGKEITNPELREILAKGDEIIGRLGDKLAKAQEKYREVQALSAKAFEYHDTLSGSLSPQVRRKLVKEEAANRRVFDKALADLNAQWEGIFVGKGQHPAIDRLLIRVQAENKFGADTDLVVRNLEKALRLAPDRLGERLADVGLNVEPGYQNLYRYANRNIELNLKQSGESPMARARTVMHEAHHAIDDLLGRDPLHVRFAQEISGGKVGKSKMRVYDGDGNVVDRRFDFFKTDKLGAEKYAHRAYLLDGRVVGTEFFEVASEGLADPIVFFRTVDSADPNVIRYLLGNLNL